jgi:late competence protein required for DNA uptake (superfamily II DNA/RNA helicase)
MDKPENLPLNEYQKRLKTKIMEGMVVCKKCGNKTNFMVNEIGHVYCENCYTKVPMLKLD